MMEKYRFDTVRERNGRTDGQIVVGCQSRRPCANVASFSRGCYRVVGES